MNPFDDPDGQFYVVVNAEGQHSIWPGALTTPAGWSVVFGVADRSACLDYVNVNWLDMRPRSLIDYMESQPSPESAPQA